jgi:hypothetical protein
MLLLGKIMKKLLVGSIIFVIIGVSCFSGCLDEKGKFIGTWQTQDGSTTLTFDANNQVTISGSGPLGILSITGVYAYSLANQKITFSSGDTGLTLNYSFPSSNQLILSNEQGGSLILTKQ